MNVPFVDLAGQYASVKEEIDGAIRDVLGRMDFILGRDVGLFEEEFAAYCEAEHGVGVDSGTSALELALRAAGIGQGDEVITAANTFMATALAISYTGAEPVLVDVDPSTYTIDPAAAERAVTEQTKAIIPVHLYGQAADMDSIMQIAGRHGLVVVEDACQAHGARYQGRRVGSLGHAAAFSFYPSKNLGAYGDGGMVVTDDDELARRVRVLRNYGQKEKNHHLTVGFNRRLDTLQAAILRAKLPHLSQWTALRQSHAALYDRLLESTGVVTPEVGANRDHVYHLYVIQVEQRDRLRAYLGDMGISTGIHYPVPIHLQPAYRSLGYGPGSFPVAEKCAAWILSLPMCAELTPEMITYVAGAVSSGYSDVWEEQLSLPVSARSPVSSSN